MNNKSNSKKQTVVDAKNGKQTRESLPDSATAVNTNHKNSNGSSTESHISQFRRNPNYNLISTYVIITSVIVITLACIIFKIFLQWAATLKAIKIFLGVLSPFLIGLLIAYLMNPLVDFLKNKLMIKVFKIKKQGIAQGLAIFLSYVLVLGFLILCFSTVIPELYNSISLIYDNLQNYYDSIMDFLDKIQADHPNWDIDYAITMVQNNTSNIMDFLKTSIGTLLPLLYNTSVSFISWTINIVIAIIVSCYMIIDKKILLRNIKKLIFVIFKKDQAVKVKKTLVECNNIFSNFVRGKMIDSLIIGILCFILMSILQLKYAVLISVIVGITNMIPYFGPFIGAVPGVILELTVGWEYALIFGILIFILQQFDGLYLGPKILGQSTGLRPLWIIFAITLGGWVAGPIGMFIGVPCIAVISYLIDKGINKILKKRNIDIDNV